MLSPVTHYQATVTAEGKVTAAMNSNTAKNLSLSRRLDVFFVFFFRTFGLEMCFSLFEVLFCFV